MLDDFSESNTCGIFRRQGRRANPFTNEKRKIWGYYITEPGGLVKRPPDGKRSFLLLLKDDSINGCYSVARGRSEVIDLTSEIEEQSMAKRKSEEAELTAALTEGEAKKLKAVGNSDMNLYASFWHL